MKQLGPHHGWIKGGGGWRGKEKGRGEETSVVLFSSEEALVWFGWLE